MDKETGTKPILDTVKKAKEHIIQLKEDIEEIKKNIKYQERLLINSYFELAVVCPYREGAFCEYNQDFSWCEYNRCKLIRNLQ
jgi:hypothetical protein